MRMGRGDVLARIDGSSPEQHGDKHALPGAQLRHIGAFKKGAERFIRQDSFIEGLGGSPDGSLSTDEVIKLIDHLILPSQENGAADYSSKGETCNWLSCCCGHFERCDRVF